MFLLLCEVVESGGGEERKPLSIFSSSSSSLSLTCLQLLFKIPASLLFLLSNYMYLTRHSAIQQYF